MGTSDERDAKVGARRAALLAFARARHADFRLRAERAYPEYERWLKRRPASWPDALPEATIELLTALEQWVVPAVLKAQGDTSPGLPAFALAQDVQDPLFCFPLIEAFMLGAYLASTGQLPFTTEEAPRG